MGQRMQISARKPLCLTSPVQMMEFPRQAADLSSGKPSGFQAVHRNPARIHVYGQGDAGEPGSCLIFIVVDGDRRRQPGGRPR